MVQSQPGQIIPRDPISKKKKNLSKKRASGVAQGVGDTEFKPQYHQKKKREEKGSFDAEGQLLPSSPSFPLGFHAQHCVFRVNTRQPVPSLCSCPSPELLGTMLQGCSGSLPAGNRNTVEQPLLSTPVSHF
jgi:hypothetical protein